MYISSETYQAAIKILQRNGNDALSYKRDNKLNTWDISQRSGKDPFVEKKTS